jgi:hypothetical protein
MAVNAKLRLSCAPAALVIASTAIAATIAWNLITLMLARRAAPIFGPCSCFAICGRILTKPEIKNS